MSDSINHPKHYTSHPSGVEAIEVCEHLSFNVGNAIKYLFRVGLKGDPRQDLEKALWYLRRETARNPEGSVGDVAKWFEAGRAVAMQDKGILGEVLRELFHYARGDASALWRMIERTQREVDSQVARLEKHEPRYCAHDGEEA